MHKNIYILIMILLTALLIASCEVEPPESDPFPWELRTTTPTVVPSVTPTGSVVPVTPTVVPSVTPTGSVEPESTVTPTAVPSVTPTGSVVPVTPTVAPSVTPTGSVEPESTVTPTATPSVTPTPTVVNTPTPTPTPVYVEELELDDVPKLPVTAIREGFEWPKQAVDNEITTIVLRVELFVNAAGGIDAVKVVNDPGNGFDEALMDAFDGITCDKPAKQGDVAVAAVYEFSMRFVYGGRGGIIRCSVL